MKKANNLALIIDFLFVINALLIIMCPLLEISNLKWILIATFLAYGFGSAFKFIILKNYYDFENLYIAISQLVFSIVLYGFDIVSSNKSLAFFLIIWILVLSIIKLIKSDYFHDLKNILWLAKVLSLIVFMLTGVVTCLNFRFGNQMSIVVIGYFFLINYIIELLNEIFRIIKE